MRGIVWTGELEVRDDVEVRDIRPDEVRVRVAEAVHRDAGAEVEVSLPALRHEPGALAALEGERRADVGRQKG